MSAEARYQRRNSEKCEPGAAYLDEVKERPVEERKSTFKRTIMLAKQNRPKEDSKED